MTVGERVKQARIKSNLSVDELAAKIGKDRSTIYRYESNEIEKLPTSIIEPLSKALGVLPSYLMGWEDVSTNIFTIPNIEPLPKTKKVPRLGTIACGEPITAEQNIDGYDLIEESTKCDFTLRCKGDSMINARIFDGDIVYIRQQSDVDDGEIAAVLINNEATLKKVFKTSDKLVLRACNPMYDDLVYTNSELENIRILGKAVAFTSVVR